MSKVWWQSKTVWVNLVGGVAVALSAVVPALAPVNDWLHANAVMVGMAWSVVGLVLRALTKGAVSLTD